MNLVGLNTPKEYYPVMAKETPRPVDVRKRFGLTQKRFADVLGVGFRTVTGWEQGLKSPSGPARALLRILDSEPEAAMRALGYKPTRKRR